MFRLKLALLIGGAVLFVWGFREQRLSSVAAAEPNAMTLQELARNGPGDNAHLVVGDFFLCTWDYVYSERKGRWTDAWVPAVPLAGEFHADFMARLEADGTWPEGVEMPTPKTIDVVFKLTNSPDEEYVGEIASADTVQGMVVSAIEDIGHEERGLLESSYPGVDFTQVAIFEPERKPRGAGQIWGLLGGGLGLFLAGGGALAYGFVSGNRREEREGEEVPASNTPPPATEKE